MRRSWSASVLCGRPEPGLQVWECSTDNCWKQQHTTDTMCPTCAASIWPSSFPQACNATPLKLLKLFNRITYSSAGDGCTLEGMLQTLFTSQSTTATICRVKTEGAKIGLLIADDREKWKTNTSTPHFARILYPSANEHRPWGCCTFSGSVLLFQW